jgi:hypothetical protein
MNVGDLVWLPERLRTGPITQLVEDVNGFPGRLVSVKGDWAQVAYPRWGEFGCRVDELEADVR